MLKYLIKAKIILLMIAIQVLGVSNVKGQAYYYDELKEGSTLFDIGPGRDKNLSFYKGNYQMSGILYLLKSA